MSMRESCGENSAKIATNGIEDKLSHPMQKSKALLLFVKKKGIVIKVYRQTSILVHGQVIVVSRSGERIRGGRNSIIWKRNI